MIDSHGTFLPQKMSAYGNGTAQQSNEPTSGVFRISWTMKTQEIQHGERLFLNHGFTATQPSHDLAHLLVAANGGLPWFPGGADREMRLAEYNAVFIEHILHRAYVSVIHNSISTETILVQTLTHARWFVDKHYAPFPTPAEEAYRMLCWELDPNIVGALCPYFFWLHSRELTDVSLRVDGVDLSFLRSDNPPVAGKALDF